MSASNAPRGRGTNGTERAVRLAVRRRRTTQSMAKAAIEGTSNSRPTTAPMEKLCWPMTCLKTSTASTLKLPPITFGAPKSLMV